MEKGSLIRPGKHWRRQGRRHRLKFFGLVAGLFFVAAFATAVTVVAVQIQAGTTAYVSGQSAWSRSQLAAVYHLESYAQDGRPEALDQARDALEVLLADRQARIGMESGTLDRAAIREALIRGKNHPDDTGRMIWLFRYFSDTPVFREAVRVWRESDSEILTLAALADQLEAEWLTGPPSATALASLQARLEGINQELETLTEEFRTTMASAARLTTRLLSLASVAILSLLVLFAWLLGWRLMRLITAAERKFRATFEQAAVGMAQVDKHGYLIDVNPALCHILGYARPTLQGRLYWGLVHPEDSDIGRAQREQLLAGSIESYTIEHRLCRRNGDSLWGKLTVSGMGMDPDYSPRYVAILEDVSESRRLSAELTYQANHDDLTDLPNRRAFERTLAETLRQARTEDSHHALAFIDLDQFKVINDTAGHAAGDHLLRQVATLLRRCLRERDLLARLGGDEFAVILKDCDLTHAQQVAEKLRLALADDIITWGDTSIRASCSIGVVPINKSSADAGSLQRTADIACYLAKEQGRNRISVLREDDQQLVTQRSEMEWLGRIRQALQDGRLFLDAQRLVHLTEPERLRYEVLVRLIDEQGKVVPPGAFLPAAERFGASHHIDRWVIEEVCTQLAAHPDHLDELEACHINLSGPTFDQKDFSDFVEAMLDQHGLAAEKFCFEITETAAVSNLGDVTTFMERLGKRGCTFALDDFGAGLSSFGYLRRLPVECIKIDGVFVRHIDSDDTDLAMVRAINEIGQTLGKIIVAEFVENEAVLALLGKMGVHYAQGYGVHRPCRFEALLAERWRPMPLSFRV